jgi:tape measure domain-containing protein
MAEYRLEFSADTSRAGRSISDLQKAIKEVTKEFNNSEIGAESFKKAAGDLSSLKKELSDAQSAVVNLDRAYRNLGRAIESQYQIYGKALKAGEKYHNDILKLAQDQLAEEDRLRNKNYQAELDDWDRRLSAAVSARNKIQAQQRAIMEFRAGMGSEGAIPEVASPIRGGADFPGSPAYKEEFELKIQPEKASLAYFEDRLKNLQKEARLIRPDTPEWKKLNREILNTEKNLEIIRRKQRPTNVSSRLGAAGGAFLYGGGLGGGVGSALGGVVGGLAGGVPGAFTGAAIGQAVDTIGRSLAGVTAQAANLQRLQRGLAQASVDAQDFASAQAAIEASSQKLLMPLDQTTKFFTQLRANTKEYNLSVQDTQQILEGTALAVMATGGSLEDLDGAMRAVVQIFSKGGVQAEELRGQLGERFPGAVVKFAQANKMSFEELQKALEDGKVGIKDFIEFAKKNYEDYAKFSEQLATAPEYAGQRLQVAFEEMQRTIGATFGSTGAQIQDTLTYIVKGITNFVKENQKFIKQFVEDWKTIITPIGKVFGQLLGILGKFLVKIGEGFQWLFSQIRQAVGLANIGELKARYDRAAAAVEGKQRPTGQGGERTAAGGELRRQFAEFDAARKAFLAAGGEAAYQRSVATGPQNLTFGGLGAGMPLERTGDDEKLKKQKIKEASELNQLAQREVELQAALGVIGKDSLTKLEAKVSVAKEILKLTLQDIRSTKTGEIQAKAIAVATLEYQKLVQEANDEWGETIKNIAKIKSEADELRLKVQGQEAPGKTPLEQALFDIEKQAIADIQRIDELLKKVNELAGNRPEGGAARTILGNLKGDIEGLTPEQKQLRASKAITENVFTDLRSQLAELKNAGKDIKTIDEIILKLGSDWSNLSPQIRSGLTALAEQIDAAKPFAEMAQAIKNARDELKALASTQGLVVFGAEAIGSSFAQSFKDTISGAQTAQQALSSFFQRVADSFLDMAAQMIQKWIQMQMLGLVQSLLTPVAGGFAGAFGASGPSFNSSIFSGSALSPGAAFGAAGAPNLSGAFGGVSNASTAFSGIKLFADGGVVTGPTLGLVGEGRFNEAVVPLPDGKSIPVELGSNGAGDISTNIVINVNGNGQTQSSMSGTGASDLGRKMEGAVKQVIVNELRPGGLLSRR